MIRQGTSLSRILALALFLVVVAAIPLVLVQPIVEQHQSYRAAITASLTQISRYREKAASLGHLRATLDGLQRSQPKQAGYLQAENRSLASAELLGRLKKVVQSASGTLVSTHFLRQKNDGDGPTRISLRAQMTANPGCLQRVFHAIESDRSFLFLDNVLITKRSSNDRQKKSRGKTSNNDLILNVQFDVYGYYMEGKGA